MTSETKAVRLNMQEAVKVTFIAKLLPDGAATAEYHERFDHMWCTGHYQCKGPKGGVYFVGRGVMGKKDEPKVKGVLKISNRKFLELKDGATTEAWFIPDGQPKAVHIGTLAEYQPR